MEKYLTAAEAEVWEDRDVGIQAASSHTPPHHWNLSSVKMLREAGVDPTTVKWRICPGETIDIDLFLHSSKEANYDRIHHLNLGEDIERNFSYAALEVKLNLKFDPLTGNAKIVGINGIKLERPVNA